MNKAEREALHIRSLIASTTDVALQKKKVKDRRKTVYEYSVKLLKPAVEMKSFNYCLLKDADNRYKIKVIEGFGLDKNQKEVIFWLPASTVEDYKLFSSVLKKRIAKDFDVKIDAIHLSYTTSEKV